LDDPVRKAEIEILRYLIAHEDARDTLEGIAKWWVDQSNEYTSAEIDEALHRLEHHELVRVWKSTSAKPVFGRATADSRLLEDYIHSLE
jgi:hypothetical protein